MSDERVCQPYVALRINTGRLRSETNNSLFVDGGGVNKINFDTSNAKEFAGRCAVVLVERARARRRRSRLGVVVGRYAEFLPDLNLVRVVYFVPVGVEDTHEFVRIAVEVLANLRERIA